MRKALLLTLVPLLALAGTVTRTIMFDSQDLVITQANGYDVVQLADFVTTLDLGKPIMPEAVFNVLVPATATVTDIKVTPLEPEQIPGTYLIHPAQVPRPISSPATPEFIKPDAATYSSAAPYPEKLVDWARTGTKSGFRVCGFALHPLAYVPASGKLTLYRMVKVEITYRENDITPTALTPSQARLFSWDVAGLVINPEDVQRFAPPTRISDDPDVDYAIVTSSSLSGYWDDLVEWRTKKGYKAEVFTTTWINANYPSGRDTQERIRMFIIDYFENHGLKFVLLAGDNSVVPCRRCRVQVGTTTGNIPADVYYADLQWSWDGNRNNIFGEMSGDTVDLFYDVYVGRASVDNSSQANTFVSKVLGYEKTPTTDYLKKMLLPYVQLWTGYSGKIISDSIAAQTPPGWTDFYIHNPTSTTPMRNAINDGYHLSHVAAHGSATGFYDGSGRTIYSTSVAGSQTNSTRPVIMNSIACISGNFEYSDCLAEALMNNANGGAVAAIMNSRYGWGTPPSMGPSEKMDNKFYDFFFRFDSVEIGVTHARSKDFYLYSAMSQPVWRWCYYCLNLFGDPNMPMWKEPPAAMDASHAGTIQTGAQSFDVTVTSGGSPVQHAFVCCYKEDEVHQTGHTNSSGQVSLTINPITTGIMYVTATAKNKLPDENTVSVTQGAPEPYLSYLHHFVDDGGNNRLDPGETANLFVTIKNIGAAQATSVQGVLRTGSGHITFIDSTSSYGNMNAGDTARGDAYRLTASSSTPPGSRISFTLHITSPEGTWDPTFQLVVGELPTPGAVVMDHDTGYCKLSVTCLGSIGFTEPPGFDLGAGFSYPKTSASQLFYSSFLMGNSASYLVDRFYGHPASSGPNTDFEIIDSLRAVIPPVAGDEHFKCVMNDGGHSSPKNLKVTQQSYMSAASGYDDFIILVYDIKNDGSSPLNGMYAGIITDFDVGSSPTSNRAYSNETKRFSYMRQSSSANPCVGVKILDPPSFANLTAVDHARYVYPDSCVTDGHKYRILNGQISMRNSNRNYDWSVGVSVGPFNLPASARQRVAFAFVGGTSESNFETNADSAQSWYDNNVVVFEPGHPEVKQPAGITCIPNPFSRSVRISYQLPIPGRVKVQVFDITGRAITTLVDDELPAGKVEAIWNPKQLANGVYLVKVTLPDGSATEKLMLLR